MGFLESTKAKVLAALLVTAVATQSAMAEIDAVDLSSADTAISGAGNAIIGVMVTILGIGLVIFLIKRK